jgi:hypothetical protein
METVSHFHVTLLNDTIRNANRIRRFRRRSPKLSGDGKLPNELSRFVLRFLQKGLPVTDTTRSVPCRFWDSPFLVKRLARRLASPTWVQPKSRRDFEFCSLDLELSRQVEAGLKAKKNRMVDLPPKP